MIKSLLAVGRLTEAWMGYLHVKSHWYVEFYLWGINRPAADRYTLMMILVLHGHFGSEDTCVGVMAVRLDVPE